MTLKTFIERLERAGLDVDVDSVLDALWLASGDWSLDLGAEAASVPPPPPRSQDAAETDETAAGATGQKTADATSKPRGRATPPPVSRGVYPRIRHPHSQDATVPATPLRLPAARTLPQRLHSLIPRGCR